MPDGTIHFGWLTSFSYNQLFDRIAEVKTRLPNKNATYFDALKASLVIGPKDALNPQLKMLASYMAARFGTDAEVRFGRTGNQVLCLGWQSGCISKEVMMKSWLEITELNSCTGEVKTLKTNDKIWCQQSGLKYDSSTGLYDMPYCK